jgi:hypothetical protein
MGSAREVVSQRDHQVRALYVADFRRCSMAFDVDWAMKNVPLPAVPQISHAQYVSFSASLAVSSVRNHPCDLIQDRRPRDFSRCRRHSRTNLRPGGQDILTRSSIESLRFEGAASASRIWVVRGSGRDGCCSKVKASTTGPMPDIAKSANQGSRG